MKTINWSASRRQSCSNKLWRTRANSLACIIKTSGMVSGRDNTKIWALCAQNKANESRRQSQQPTVFVTSPAVVALSSDHDSLADFHPLLSTWQLSSAVTRRSSIESKTTRRSGRRSRHPKEQKDASWYPQQQKKKPPRRTVWAESICWTASLQYKGCDSLHKHPRVYVCVCAIPPPHTHTLLTSHSGSSVHPLRKQQAELIWLTWSPPLSPSCSPPKCPAIFSSIDTSRPSACSPLQQLIKTNQRALC